MSHLPIHTEGLDHHEADKKALLTLLKSEYENLGQLWWRLEYIARKMRDLDEPEHVWKALFNAQEGIEGVRIRISKAIEALGGEANG